MKIQLGSESYQGRAVAINGQRLVNLYAEAAPEGGSYPFALFGTPGLREWADLAAALPVYGSLVMAGILYVVLGNTVYKLSSTGVPTSIGTIGANTDRVQMKTNGTQLAILKSNGDLWVATSSTVTQVTDADYLPSSSMTVQDSYLILTVIGTKKFIISAPGDFTAYDALDFASAEDSPGNLVCAYAFNSGLWLIKEEDTEVWYDSGNADFPFEPISGAVVSRGCLAKHTVVDDDNTIFWLGNDKIVYRFDGYTPKRVSTHAIETAIETYETTDDAFGYIYTQEGHKFYCMTFPTENATWCYDIASDKWHERESWEDDASLGRWRVNTHSVAYGKHIVGDYVNGKLYILDMDTYTEDGEQIRRYVDCPPVWQDNARLRHNTFYVDFLTGQGLTTGQGSDPQAWLQWSDDGGQTFGNQHWRAIGQIGQYGIRAVWRRLGQARKRIYRVGIADPVKVAILGGYLDFEAGIS